MQRKKKAKKKKQHKMVPMMMPVVLMNPYTSMEPGQMPTFKPGKNGQVPYQLAFAPMPPQKQSSKTKKKKNVKNSKGHSVSFNSRVDVSPEPSTSALPQSSRMVTFSKQVRKHKTRSKSSDVVPTTSGSFTGHASMHVSTITKNSNIVKKGIMKKSSSDSSKT